MMYIPINVVNVIVHEWFSFVQAYVLMGYLHSKSYCWLVKFLRGIGNDVLIATLKI